MGTKFFYDTIRPMFGKLSQLQVDGIEAILHACEALPNLAQTAYVLATTFHETAATMQPIEERGKGKGYDYGKKLKMGGGPKSRIPYINPDKLYYGRGHTQNTWYENYEMLTRQAKLAGHAWDFLNNPELLLQMEPSLWATILCMRKGYYTGVGLDRYFSDTRTDFVNARKIINGLDAAERIAGYAEIFHQALLELPLAV